MINLYNTIQHNTTQYSIPQHITTHHSTTQHNNHMPIEGRHGDGQGSSLSSLGSTASYYSVSTVVLQP